MKFTIGMEMTGIIKEYEETMIRPGVYHRTNKAYSITHAASIFVAKELNKHLGKEFFKLGGNLTDGHCLEFPSPVYPTKMKLRNFAKRVFSAFRKFGVAGQHPTTVCGGGHLHFGLKNKELVRAIFKDFANRPYLSWIFMDVGDTDSGNHIHNQGTGSFDSYFGSWQSWNAHNLENYRDYFSGSNSEKLFQWLFLKNEVDFGRHIAGHLGSKDDALCLNNGGKTIEFRCVSAPRNIHEFDDYVDFWIAYIQYVNKQFKSHGLPDVMSSATFEAKKPTYIDELNQLILDMGLKPKRYAKYIRANVKPRI